jgi:hypothetical protein
MGFGQEKSAKKYDAALRKERERDEIRREKVFQGVHRFGR